MGTIYDGVEIPPSSIYFALTLQDFPKQFLHARGHHGEGDEIQILSVDLMSFRKRLRCKLSWGY